MVIYLCPVDRKYACSWEGHSSDILDHFEKEHDDLLFFTNSADIDLKTESENRLFFIDDEIYLAQTKVCGKTLTIFLRYLGPDKLAAKINYTVFLKIKNESVNQNYISVSENGSLVVNLELLEPDYAELEYMECTFNITKEFSSNSSDDGVFLEDDVHQEHLDFPHMPIPRKLENDVHQEHLDFLHMPIPRKRSFDEGKRKKSDTENNTIEVTLTRSKTTNFEEIKRRNVLKRCNSSISLDAIQENDSELNCTNCGVILIPPIFLCPCDHNFCLKCQNGICKLCTENVTYERNADLEDKYHRYLHPCKYKKMGCPHKLIYSDLHLHEIICTFCEYRCPMDECSFESQFKGISKHLKLIHGSTKILEVFILAFHNMSEAFLVNEEKGVFYCYARYLSDSVLWEAKFCGPKERRFFCELKFKDGKLKKPLLMRKIDNTYSVRMSHQDLKRLKLKSKNAILTITC